MSKTDQIDPKKNMEKETKVKEIQILTDKNKWKTTTYNGHDEGRITRPKEVARKKESEDRNRHKKEKEHWGSMIGEKPSNTMRILGHNLDGLRPCHLSNKKLESLKRV